MSIKLIKWLKNCFRNSFAHKNVTVIQINTYSLFHINTANISETNKNLFAINTHTHTENVQHKFKRKNTKLVSKNYNFLVQNF